MANRLPDKLRGSRRGKPSESLIVAVNNAIDTVYGSDYTYEVRSGIAHPGTAGAKSGRHVTTQGAKGAADFKIYDPSGKQLAGKALEPLAKHWVSNYGSIGVNSKPGETGPNFTHLDLIRRSGNMTRVWTYGAIPGFDRAAVAALAGTGEQYRTWANPENAASVTWTSDAIPTPPNPIPGIPDPTAPIPRANPLFTGPQNIFARYFEGLQTVTRAVPGLTGTVEASPDATAETKVGLRNVVPTPVPRARPNQLEQTVARIVNQKGLLKKGAKGDAVKEVQRVLNAMGVTDGRGRPLELDGRLGARTRQAIERYQNQYPHLKTDGILGPRTLAQLVADVESPEPIDVSQMTAQQQLALTNPEISSPAAQIAANMGTSIATGFAAPGGFTSIPGVDTRWNYQPGMTVPGASGYRIPSPGTIVGDFPEGTAPARPVSRTPTSAYPTDVWEAANAFTPHTSGSLGTPVEALDRDGEIIGEASRAFAMRRIEDQQGQRGLDRGDRGYEFATERDAFGRTISAGTSIKGTGLVGVGSRAGFRAGTDAGSAFDARSNTGFRNVRSDRGTDSDRSSGAASRPGRETAGTPSRPSSTRPGRDTSTPSRPSTSRPGRSTAGSTPSTGTGSRRL